MDYSTASAGSKINSYILADDLISVKNSFLERTSRTLKAVTEPFVGIYVNKELVDKFK